MWLLPVIPTGSNDYPGIVPAPWLTWPVEDKIPMAATKQYEISQF